MTDRASLTVYYDGGCPVCSREIGFYRTQAGADGICFVDAATCDPAALGPALDRDSALRRLHARRASGEIVSGTAAFTEIWRSLPRFSWLGRVASWRPVAAVLALGYAAFLQVRPLWRR